MFDFQTCIIVTALVAAVLSFLAPSYYKSRDTNFQRPLPAIDFGERIVRQGHVVITHDSSTLKRVEDGQGPPPSVDFRMAYRTSYSDGDTAMCNPAKHVVLIHGTGHTGDFYHWTKEKLRAVGANEMAAVLSPELERKSIVDRLHEQEDGVCVTTIDMRGHGHSDSPIGPYSVQLIAADVAEGLKLIHGEDTKYHLNGLSLGWGVSLSIAFHYPEIVSTVSGGGFLADRTASGDLAARFGSFPQLIDLLGLELLGKAANFLIHCVPYDSAFNMLRYQNMNGYKHASASWLNYNERHMYAELKAPLLFLNPVRDDLAGVYMPLIEAEMNDIPGEKKLVVFNTTGKEDHCHQLFAPDEYFGHFLEFLRQHS